MENGFQSCFIWFPVPFRDCFHLSQSLLHVVVVGPVLRATQSLNAVRNSVLTNFGECGLLATSAFPCRVMVRSKFLKSYQAAQLLINSMEKRRRVKKAIGMTAMQHLKVMVLYNKHLLTFGDTAGVSAVLVNRPRSQVLTDSHC